MSQAVVDIKNAVKDAVAGNIKSSREINIALESDLLFARLSDMEKKLSDLSDAVGSPLTLEEYKGFAQKELSSFELAVKSYYDQLYDKTKSDTRVDSYTASVMKFFVGDKEADFVGIEGFIANTEKKIKSITSFNALLNVIQDAISDINKIKKYNENNVRTKRYVEDPKQITLILSSLNFSRLYNLRPTFEGYVKDSLTAIDRFLGNLVKSQEELVAVLKTNTSDDASASPLQDKSYSVRTIPLHPEARAMLKDLKEYFYESLDKLFGKEETFMKSAITTIKKSESFQELFAAVKFIKNEAEKDAIARHQRNPEEIIDGDPIKSKHVQSIKEIIINSKQKVAEITKYLKNEVDDYIKKHGPVNTSQLFSPNNDAEVNQYRELSHALIAVGIFMAGIRYDSSPTASPLTPQEILERAEKELHDTNESFQYYRRNHILSYGERIEGDNPSSEEDVIKKLNNEILALQNLIEKSKESVISIDPVVAFEAKRISIFFKELIKELKNSSNQSAETRNNEVEKSGSPLTQKQKKMIRDMRDLLKTLGNNIDKDEIISRLSRNFSASLTSSRLHDYF